MPDRQRQGFFSRVPKKRSKQGFPRLRDYNTFAKSRHRAPHGSFMLRNLLRALGCEFIEPINQFCLATTLLDETVSLGLQRANNTKRGGELLTPRVRQVFGAFEMSGKPSAA
jgi:hypothetical protein